MNIFPVFLQATADGSVVLLNYSHIVSISSYTKQSGTCITLSNGEEFKVDESVEQISNLLISLTK